LTIIKVATVDAVRRRILALEVFASTLTILVLLFPS
jgi:hypothetical protein